MIDRKLILALAAVMTLGFAGAAQAGVLGTATVYGTSNPFLAGQPPGTPCCGGDSTPGEQAVLASIGLSPGEILTFSATGGFNYFPTTPLSTPDGYGNSYVIDMTADNGTGISGAMGVAVSGLVGVFTDGSIPGGPAPGQLNSGMSFSSLAPGLDQIFWIGDGLTGTGTGSVQQFVVPVGATELWFGSVDGFGWYNNVGVVNVTISSAAVGVPEPGTLALLGAGLAGLGGLRFRRRRTNKAA